MPKLDTLPQEMFFHVVSFLGPSRDLLSLTLTSRQIHYWLELVGNSVAASVLRYRNIRTFLLTDSASSSIHESNLCLVVRHAMYVDTVRCRMNKLSSLIAHDFDESTVMSEGGTWVTEDESCHIKRKFGHSTSQDYHQPQRKRRYSNTVQDMGIHRCNSYRPQQSIDITFELLSSYLGLSCPVFTKDHDPFISPLSNEISISASTTLDQFLHQSCPRSMERIFLLLCGKLCAKAYKWVKARVAAEQSSQTHVTQYNATQSQMHTCHSQFPIYSLDEQRLFHLRRILHLVFTRVLDIRPMDTGKHLD